MQQFYVDQENVLRCSPTPSPKDEAENLRRAAEQASGSDRAYLLWLAAEWDKSAERDMNRTREAATSPHQSRARRRTASTG